MISLFLLLVSGALVSSQTTLDPSLLIDIFGTPPPTTRPTNLPPRLEDITVSPTTGTQVYKDKNGEDCQCVPYYLCDSNLRIIKDNLANFTGFGELDIRFGGKEDCQESVEKCCQDPANEIPEIPVKALKGCGYRNPKGVDFTVVGGNGDEAQFGEFPWVVALINSTDFSYAGVGVLIHPEVVMTGAHIASKFAPGTLVARAGEWDTQTTKERLPAQERAVQEIVVRDDFKPKSLRNDMALLRLQEPLELAEHINVICLPNQDESFENSRGCIANGWGKTVFGLKNRYAVILKRVEIDMVPHRRCSDLLKKTRLGQNFNLHDSFVCAGGEEGKDTCQGDGGAPLACPVGEDRYKLSGLVAWGIGCGQKDVPAVYARVAKFRQWVDDVMVSWDLGTDGYKI